LLPTYPLESETKGISVISTALHKDKLLVKTEVVATNMLELHISRYKMKCKKRDFI